MINLCDFEVLNLSLENIFFDYIFHAAAYKHVNLLQSNQLSGIKNNLIGTYNLLNITYKSSKNFIHISTDKAVNPINIMGLSKNLCEKIIKKYSNMSSICKYNIVRFGNVLHSSGSVIPIFQNQISKNKNITVTDKEATRYFMTIPEAVSLVIGASTLQTNGSIYVLDMGEPVKILDVAIHMIKMAGLVHTYNEPKSGEIKIEFIGIRDGEKISEELTEGKLIDLDIDGVFEAIEKEPNLSNLQEIIDLLNKEKLVKQDLKKILSLAGYG